MQTYYRACAAPRAGKRTKQAGLAPRAKRPYIVVVVDDEPDFCTVIGELLRNQNLVVHAAYGALEGLSLIQNVHPDLVLTDVMMPEVNGLELIRRLRADPVLGRVPTIVVSALVKHEEQAAALSAGADAFIPKPFSIQQLREAIAQYLH
jgi:two-component system, sensor histidine kinase ChiS